MIGHKTGLLYTEKLQLIQPAHNGCFTVDGLVMIMLLMSCNKAVSTKQLQIPYTSKHKPEIHIYQNNPPTLGNRSV